jgi:hypothetical protein
LTIGGTKASHLIVVNPDVTSRRSPLRSGLPNEAIARTANEESVSSLFD